MARTAGKPESTKRWDKSEDAKFREQVKEGIIDIDDISPKFIENVRENHGWKNRPILNFRTNYRRVANTLRLARDLNGARNPSEYFVFIILHIIALLTTAACLCSHV